MDGKLENFIIKFSNFEIIIIVILIPVIIIFTYFVHADIWGCKKGMKITMADDMKNKFFLFVLAFFLKTIQPEKLS